MEDRLASVWAYKGRLCGQNQKTSVLLKLGKTVAFGLLVTTKPNKQ